MYIQKHMFDFFHINSFNSYNFADDRFIIFQSFFQKKKIL